VTEPPSVPPETQTATDDKALEVRSGLARSTAAMTAGTVISRVTGVLRLAVLAATLGVTETRFTDTYNLANMAPNILYELVLGGVITAVFVPVFVELLHKDDRNEAWRDLSGIVNWALLGLTALAIVGMIAAPWIAEFYASRLGGELGRDQQRVITFLLRLFIPQVVFYGIYFMGSGLLNAHKRFALPMFTPIMNNIVLIVVLIVFHRMYGLVEIDTVTTPQLLLLGLGTTASVAPMGLLLLPSIRKLGGYRLTLSVDRELVRKLVRLSGYITGTVAANQLGYLVVQWLANARQGGYTAYLSAFAFFLLPIGLFVWSLTTALAPTLSRNALTENWDAFKGDLSTGLRATIFLTLPATAGFLLLGDPLVEAFLRHGVVTAGSTELIVDVLTFLVLGLVQFSLFQVLSRAFYAMQNGKTPFLVNCLVIGVNVAINIPMYGWLGIKGLAAGHAIAYTLGVLFLTRSLTDRIGDLDVRGIWRSFLRMAAATAGMSVLVWAIVRGVGAWLGTTGTTAPVVILMVATLVGGLAYLALAAAFKVEELSYVRNVIARRRGAQASG
jgi:putative peptidoglycan lipid II flippase